MLDVLIKGGLVVDGTGTAPTRADIGIRDGQIERVGQVDEAAAKTIDAVGLVVCPGFVDPHTHYDAQLFWDPTASPSSWHGVTTVIGGNCGFTLAPLRASDADYTRAMMAQVEGMPLASLEVGLPWTWETFPQYLDALEGRIGVNAGFMVGHCALRVYVMGPDFAREASGVELEKMGVLLNEYLAAGGLGLSTSRSYTHTDASGDPVPSRWASEGEVIELCGVVGRHDGTSLELINDGCVDGFSDTDVEFIARLAATAGKPLNWNILAISAAEPGKADRQLRPSVRAREMGAQVVALTMPVPMYNSVSFGSFCTLWHIPGWREVLDLPIAERINRLQDPATRADLLAKANASRWIRFADFENYTIGDVFTPANEPYRDRRVGEISSEQGREPFATLVDIIVADGLRTVLWPPPSGDGAADWEARRQLWESDDVLLGGSDAGAHLDRLLGADYPSRFLADTIRGRRLVSLERAVQLMTDIPARFFGIQRRGRLAPGYAGDVVVFDPELIGSRPPRTSRDLPGNSERLVADCQGIVSVLVNGVETIVKGQVTGELPGTLLRSGRDTTDAVRGR